MIEKYIWPVVLVSLSDPSVIKPITSKFDYTLPYAECQPEKQKNTLEYNYITTEELIESNNKKYQDLLW